MKVAVQDAQVVLRHGKVGTVGGGIVGKEFLIVLQRQLVVPLTARIVMKVAVQDA